MHKKTTSFALLLFLLCFCSILLLNCQQHEQPQSPTIAVIYPLSGDQKNTGIDLLNGIVLAQQVVNEAVDLNLPLAKTTGLPNHGNVSVSTTILDSKNEPGHATLLVEGLAGTHETLAIIGCGSSKVTAAASKQAELHMIPFLNPESTAPTLTKRGFRWFFRTTPDDAMFSQNFFDFLTTEPVITSTAGHHKIALVYEDSVWGTGVAREELRQAMQRGYDVVADIPYDFAKGNLNAHLTALKQANPDIILQSSYIEDAVAFMNGYKEHGIKPAGILAMDGGFIDPTFIARLGNDAEGVLSREVFSHDLFAVIPTIQVVNAMYKKKFGRDMSGNSARSFTGFLVLCDALNRAKSFEADDVRQALLQTSLSSDQLIMPWDGVAFDQSGQNTLGKGIIVQIQSGQYKTVWPKELATAPLIWPLSAAKN